MAGAALAGPLAQPITRLPAAVVPATPPAVTSVRRLTSRVGRYSYCSAMLILAASRGGTPKSGMAISMPGPCPAQVNTGPTYG